MTSMQQQGIVDKPSKVLTNFGHSLLPSLLEGKQKDEIKSTNELNVEDLNYLLQRIKGDNQSISEQESGFAAQLSVSYIAFADRLLDQMSRGDRQTSEGGSQFDHLHKQVASLQLKNDSLRQRLRECLELVDG